MAPSPDIVPKAARQNATITGELYKKARIKEIEEAARAAYQALAKEYYTHLHPTSRAFSWTLDHWLAMSGLTLEQGGWYLEIGAGKGRIQRLRGARTARSILLDISDLMLSQQSSGPGEAHVYRVQGSAFALPFPDSTMDGIFSFLGDSFNHLAYYAEACRVLKRSGRYLHVIPHYEWGAELRKLLGMPRDATFFLRGGIRITVPSLLKAQHSIERELRGLGFKNISLRELSLPTDYPPNSVPEHIALPSKSLNISPYDLKLLLAVEAKKA